LLRPVKATASFPVLQLADSGSWDFSAFIIV
jgi:hypothetical protein